MLCSFIIPAYNASTTIVRCMDSIYALPLNEPDFEVIVIDDFSQDHTIKVIEQYAKQHTNITLICQTENHRQGAARNRGVFLAKGKYILFVDSDDETDVGIIDALQLAEQNHLDMVAMNYVRINEIGDVVLQEMVHLTDIFTGVELQTKHPYWFTGPVAYLYRKSFMQKVGYPFEEDVLFEDSDFVNVHLYHAKRMMYCITIGYRAFYNVTSTVHTFSYQHIADYLLLGIRMLKFYDSLEETTSVYAQSILKGGSYNVWMACKRLVKLPSQNDILAFYNRVDSLAERSKLQVYNEPKIYWTWWTKLCVKYKNIAIVFAIIGQVGYKLAKLIKP